MQVQTREIESSPGEEMIRVRKSQINFYKNVLLYPSFRIQNEKVNHVK
jgi:hypothetical protein